MNGRDQMRNMERSGNFGGGNRAGTADRSMGFSGRDNLGGGGGQIQRLSGHGTRRPNQTRAQSWPIQSPRNVFTPVWQPLHGGWTFYGWRTLYGWGVVVGGRGGRR